MITFKPSAPVKAFFDALEAAANSTPVGAAYSGGAMAVVLAFTLPTPPAPPTDPHELAFFNHVCMPLYNLLQSALAQGGMTGLFPRAGVAVPTYCPPVMSAP